MKCIINLFLTILAFSISTNILGQDLGYVRTVQEVSATKLIEQIQRSDTSSINKYFASSYYSKNSKKLLTFFKLFQSDFNNLPGNIKRFSILEFPKGLNLVKFRYIGETGTILQVEVSYKDGDINSKIVHLSLITTKSLLQERKTNRAAGYDFDL